MDMGNFEVDHACCVDEAFKKLSTKQYDVVISDYEMPQKNGLDFLKELKEQNNRIPFILFTGKGREDVAVQALNLGADSYLNKNGSPETVYCELANAINKTVERKKSRKLLAESESKYRALVENSLQGIAILLATPLRIVFANGAFGKILGYSSQELTSLSPEGIMRLVYQEDRAVFFKRMEDRLRGEPAETCYDFRAVRKDGSVIWLSALSNRVDYDGLPAVQGMFLDVNKSKKASEALCESEQRYRELADSLPDIVFETDLRGQLVFANKRAAEISGYSHRELEEGLNMLQFLAPEDRERALKNIQRLFTGDSYVSTEYTFVRKDGTIYPAIVTATPCIHNNKVIGLRGIVLDITERKRMEDQLKVSEERFRLLFEYAPDAYYLSDLKGTFVDGNKSAEEMTGYPRSELIGKSFLSLNLLPRNQILKAAKLLALNVLDKPTGPDEFILSRKNGTQVSVEIRTHPLKIQGKKLVLGIARDITERKKVEEELRSASLYSRSLIETSLDPLVTISKEGKITDVNRATERVTGCSREELVGSDFSDYFVEPEKARTGYQKIFDEGAVKDYPLAIRHKSGRVTDVLYNASIYRNRQGEVQGVFAAARDITERKKAEETTKKQAALIDLSPDAIIVKKSDETITYWNIGAEKLYGYTKQEAGGQKINVLLKAKYSQSYDEITAQLEQGKNWTGEITNYNKNNNKVTVQSHWTATLNSQGAIEEILESNIDITERKKAEEVVRKSEAKYQELANFLPEIVFEADLTGKITFFSQRALEVAGFTREELEKGLNLLSFVVPEERERAMENIKKSLAGVEHWANEYMLLRRNGTTYPAIVRTSAIISENKVIGLRGIALDITDRKKTEEALQESEKKSRAIVASSPIGIATSGADEHFLSANEAFCKILDYTEDELRKLTFKDITHPADLKESVKKMGELEDGRASSFTLEKRYVKKDGTVIDGKIMVSAVRNQNSKPNLFVAELEDITERKKAEEHRKALERKINDYSKHLKYMVDLRTAQLKDANERIVKSERLTAIGELAGMVGHDLRNPLAGIKNAAYFLKKKGTAISEAQSKEMLEIIDKAIDYSDKIINDLLDYAREMHLELTKYAAHALVDEAIGMVQVPDRIQILNHVDEEARIWVNTDKMMRVFVNLIKNAIDAIPEKGTLKISSCQTRDFVEIAFADTGTGIPEETLQKLFTPLFTTKAQGMGFGLAICKRIIEAHEGTITVKTAVNKGTTFTISLPIKPKLPLFENKPLLEKQNAT